MKNDALFAFPKLERDRYIEREREQEIHLLQKIIILAFQNVRFLFQKCLGGYYKVYYYNLSYEEDTNFVKALHLIPLYLTQVPHILAHKNV